MIDERDLVTDVYTSGRGINPMVQVLHRPSGRSARSNATASQVYNRTLAVNQLREMLGEPMGGPDATAPDAVDLLREWFHWWHATGNPAGPPARLHVRTAAYLAARAVTDGRRMRTPGDL